MRNSVSVTVVLQYANGENGDEILSVGFVTESGPSLAELIRLLLAGLKPLPMLNEASDEHLHGLQSAVRADPSRMLCFTCTQNNTRG